MNRQYTSILIVVTAAILLSILYCPPFDVFFDDKEIFRYTGLAILKGRIPYMDFFDHKPPLIFFLNAAGQIFGSWGLWIIDTLLVLWASILFLRLCETYRLSCPWLLPVIFNLLLRDHILSMGIGMTREYTAILYLMAFCTIMGKYRHRDILLGIISGLTFFMQQDQILPLIPLLFVYLLTDNQRSLGVRILFMTAGFLAVTLPIILYFVFHHALAEAWKDAFLFNFSWYTKEKLTTLQHFKAIKTGLNEVGIATATLIIITLGVGAFFLRHTQKRWLIACLLSVFFALSSEYLSGRMPIGGSSFYYYFLPLSATLSALLFIVIAFTEDPAIQSKTSRMIYGFLICFGPLYVTLGFAAHLSPYKKNFVTGSPELAWLRQQPLKDYQLYVFGDNNYDYVYNEHQILAPSRWIYHHFWSWYDRWDPDQAILRSIQQELLLHHTTYILNYANAARFRNPASYRSWSSFLEKYYEPLAIPNTSVLWRLKDVPQQPGR